MWSELNFSEFLSNDGNPDGDEVQDGPTDWMSYQIHVG
jgi:hypothetical protein